MSNKNKQPVKTMAEIQRDVADTVSPESLAAVGGFSNRLTELRRPGAHGTHLQGHRGNRTRHDQDKNAINDSRSNS